MGDNKMTNTTHRRESSGLLNMLIRAEEFRRQNDYHSALAMYFGVLERYGPTPDLYTVVASCYCDLATYDQNDGGQSYRTAVAWIEKAIQLTANDADLYALLGTYHWLGTLDYEKAINAFRMAIELDPCDAMNLFTAAKLYDAPEEVATLKEAIGWLERAVGLEPTDPNYRSFLGQLYLKAGRRTDAEKQFVKALLCPRLPEPFYTQLIMEVIGTSES